jgi:hypothetical protein
LNAPPPPKLLRARRFVRRPNLPLIRINDTGYRPLRQLALDEDTTLQALAIEALNDLLKKRGTKPVVANPLRQTD